MDEINKEMEELELSFDSYVEPTNNEFNDYKVVYFGCLFMGALSGAYLHFSAFQPGFFTASLGELLFLFVMAGAYVFGLYGAFMISMLGIHSICGERVGNWIERFVGKMGAGEYSPYMLQLRSQKNARSLKAQGQIKQFEKNGSIGVLSKTDSSSSTVRKFDYETLDEFVKAYNKETIQTNSKDPIIYIASRTGPSIKETIQTNRKDNILFLSRSGPTYKGTIELNTITTNSGAEMELETSKSIKEKLADMLKKKL
jgi:hypothetical protein